MPEEKSDQKGTMKSNEKCATILPLDPLTALATCQGAFFLLLATWENVDTVVRVTRVKAGPKRKKNAGNPINLLIFITVEISLEVVISELFSKSSHSS